MSVLDINKVDFISIDKKSGRVMLTISDHLDWDDSFYHLSVLQEKINSYIRLIESEEIFEVYPDAIGKEIDIKILGKYNLNNLGIEFVEKVRNVLQDLNIGIQFNFIAS